MAWQTKLIAGEGETIPMKKFINLMSGMTRMLAMMTLLAAAAQAQTSRAATASSYLERGNVWVRKGAFDRAIDDFALAISGHRSLPNRLPKPHGGDITQQNRNTFGPGP